MGFRENFDFSTLVNEKENWVIEELGKQLSENPSICSCPECVLDMTALALNLTKPNYRVTLMGAIYAMSEEESVVLEIEGAVSRAVTQVNANPACERRLNQTSAQSS